MSSFREQTEENLISTTQEIARAQSEADAANERLANLQRQARAMQAALDVMDGKEAPAPIIFPMQGSDARFVSSPLPTPPAGAQYAKLNGEDILLEPGTRIGKNSFNEDVIVPIDSVDPPLMQEPAVLETRSANILPPLRSSDTFGSDDPNEIFS